MSATFDRKTCVLFHENFEDRRDFWGGGCLDPQCGSERGVLEVEVFSVISEGLAWEAGAENGALVS
jgi:hypothetical protein